MYRVFDLDVWLLEEGYLRIKKDALSRLKFLLWKMGFTWESLYRHIFLRTARLQARGSARSPVDYARFIPLVKKIFLSTNNIDWSHTRAYCKFGMGQIVLNVKGREPQGIVSPGKEYEELRAEIAEKLRTLRDPQTGREVKGRVFLREEIYGGKYFAQAPDLTCITADSHYYTSNLSTFTANRIFCDNLMMPGNHTLWGILMAKGKPLEHGKEVSGAKIIDITPTILYLLGYEIPRDMDGQVLTEGISPEFLRENPLRFSTGLAEGLAEGQTQAEEEGESGQMTAAEREDIIRKLQGLGYIN
jgi:predicted AlkP superfamily phosphohydrolase/phosphomutase